MWNMEPIPIGEEIIVKSRDGKMWKLTDGFGNILQSGRRLNTGHNLPCILIGGRPPASSTESKIFYILASGSTTVHKHADKLFPTDMTLTWEEYR